MPNMPQNYHGMGIDPKNQPAGINTQYVLPYGLPDTFGIPLMAQPPHYSVSHQLHQPQYHQHRPQHQNPQPPHPHILQSQHPKAPMHQIIPVQHQLSQLSHVSLRHSSPPHPDLGKGGQHLHLSAPQQVPYTVKLEGDLSGYPIVGNAGNLIVYTPYQPDNTHEQDGQHPSEIRNESVRQTFIPSKQSLLVNNISATPETDMEKPKPSTEVAKPHVCSQEGCSWAFARQSDLRRHAKSHKKPTFHCPYWKADPTCHRNGGSFNRLDVLKRHLRLVHFIRDKQHSYGKSDPGWCRSCQKLFASSKVFIDHCVECASRVATAEWKSAEKAQNEGSVALVSKD